jgi:hypothetical protein
VAHISIYVVAWLVIYVRNKEEIAKHKIFAVVLSLIFLPVSLILSGFIFENFEETWISAFSWPMVVSYLLLEYTKKERRTVAYESALDFLEGKKRFYMEILDRPDSEQFEKEHAKLVIKGFTYAIEEVKGLSGS